MSPVLKSSEQAKDGQEAIEFAQKHMPNVILMDISMPGVNGIEATRVIHERHPEVCIIGLSMYDDPEKERAMRAPGPPTIGPRGALALNSLPPFGRVQKSESLHRNKNPSGVNRTIYDAFEMSSRCTMFD